MAKKFVEELWIGINADISEMRKGFSTAEYDVKSFVGHIGKSSKALQDFGLKATLAGVSLAGMAGTAVKVFAKFEQSMANAFSVLGAGKEEMQALNEYARKMGEATIFSASQAADAMYYLASAGYNAQQTIGALKGTLDLAAATQFDLAETTRIVVNTLNQFALDATEASRVANVFAATAAASQAEMSKLGISMAYVGPIAASLNLSLETTSAALGILYNAGLEASTAGTAMRAGLLRLAAPVKKADKAIMALGLTAEQVNPQFHSLSEILDTFSSVGAGATDKIDELNKIFGTEAVTAWVKLIQGGSKALNDLEGKVTGTNKAAEMAEIQVNTLSGAWKLFKSALEETGIQLGEALMPTLRLVTSTITNVVTAFNKLPSVVKIIIASITGFGGALLLLVGPIAMLLARLPALIASITALGVSTKIALGWVGLITIAVTAAAAALGAYVNSQVEAKTKTDEAKDAAAEQMIEFDSLKNILFELKGKQKMTTAETLLYKQTVEKLQKLYPKYLQNIDFEKTKLDDLKVSMKAVRVELEKLNKQKVFQALMEDEQDKVIKAGKAMIKGQKDLNDATNEYNKLFVERAQMDAGDKLIDFLIGDPFDMKGDQMLRDIKKINEGIKANEKVYEDATKAMIEYGIEAKKVAETLINPAGTIVDEEDDGDPIVTPTTKDDKDEKLKKLAEDRLKFLAEIEKKILDGQINALEEGKNKSLEAEVNYYKVRELVETTFANKRFEAMKKEAEELGVWEAEKVRITQIYLDETAAIKEKSGAEQKGATERWTDLDFQLLDNKVKYQLETQKITLDGYKKHLQNRLQYLIENGKAEISEAYAIRRELDDIEKGKSIPGEKKKKFNMDEANNMYQKGELDIDLYALQLEDYEKFLNEKILLAEQWSEEYMNILQEMKAVEAAQQDVFLNKNRVMFLSIADMQRIALDSMSNAWGHLWNKYVIDQREAKNEMDELWLVIKNSALNAIGEILQSELTKAFMSLLKNIAMKLFGAATGGASAAIPTEFFNFPMLATGGEITKTGMITAHAGEIVVPADVVKKSRGNYESAAEATFGNNSKKQVVNNYNIVLNNPVVNDSVYWEKVMTNHIIPATGIVEKRYGTK